MSPPFLFYFFLINSNKFSTGFLTKGSLLAYVLSIISYTTLYVTYTPYLI
nr:MAG TPA: hypothetical protein [Caudoviricetes sp.]